MKKPATALSVLAIAAIASTSSVFAAAQVDSRDLTASQARQLVQEQGSVLISTGANQFDRYVANGSYCGVGSDAQPAYIPTANSDASLVGYTCEAIQSNS
ncbi:hypothetical protein SAMN04488056_107108 [Cohaesibacter marisflavi]|uniref:Uncharacterized protein n=1 Tax=Cohaesibacter marisflavi TaxID=655353 RepID=A0A1I5HSS3_9HYPH|nr:hypothetical protein [Cohaesibacter marisflavi]SFO51317.1 hypothetical protein SAMN04488056_107108 [Cohaesibacter marisflavi]